MNWLFIYLPILSVVPKKWWKGLKTLFAFVYQDKMTQNIKEKVLKDMFPNKTFIFLRKDGVNYISDDIVDILSKHKKDLFLAEVGKVIEKNIRYFEKLAIKIRNSKPLGTSSLDYKEKEICFNDAVSRVNILNELKQKLGIK